METIAVFTGDNHEPRPSEYRYRVINTQVHFQYQAYHIFDHGEEALLAMDNIFAFLVVACQKALLEGKVAEEELGDNRLTIAKTLLKRNYDKDRIIKFLVFLKNFLYVDNQDHQAHANCA